MLWVYDRHGQVAGRKKSARDPVISHLANVAIAEAGREVAYLQGCSSRPLPFGQRLTAGQAEGAGTTISQAGPSDQGENGRAPGREKGGQTGRRWGGAVQEKKK